MAIVEVLHQGPLIHKASRALILLHGRGGTAQGMRGLADLLVSKDTYVAIPQAENNTWYPYGFMEQEQLNEPFLSESIQSIKNLIASLEEHISKQHICLVGFSQGACLALEVAARFATKYAGVIAFTGGLIGPHIIENKYHGNFEKTKVFIGNSDQDPHVPLIRSEQSKKQLETMGAEVTLNVYPGMSHTINSEEIQWVKNNIFIS